MGLFNRTGRAAPPRSTDQDPPINSVAELLRHVGAADLHDLRSALELTAGLERHVVISQTTDDGLCFELGDETHDITFPTTWKALVSQIEELDEDENSLRDFEDWSLWGDDRT